MKCTLDSIDRLPELPLEVFELSGKLGYSKRAPVLTIKPDRLPVPEAPARAIPPMENRSSFAIKQYAAFVYYPLVFCYLVADDSVLESLAMENQDAGAGQNQIDMEAVSSSRRYYKLSRFGGHDPAMRWICVVNFGPHGAFVVEQESCDGLPAMWKLFAPEPDIELKWIGKWENIPAFPNLHVDMASLWLREATTHCCPGFTWCATTRSCLPNRVKCPEAVPA